MNVANSKRPNTTPPFQTALTDLDHFEVLKMFDEAMRPDPLLPLPASPNWAVGFLSGFIQTYVEGESQQTEPLSTLAKEEA